MARKQVKKPAKARKSAVVRKKVTAKVQQSSQQPPQALLEDVQKLFAKHDWSGNLVGRSLAATGATTCPPGTTPHEITYQLPDGTWVTKTVCLPNSSMGAVSLPGEPFHDDFSELCEAGGGLAGDSGKEDSDEAPVAGDSGKTDPD